MGYEYELLREFAKERGLELRPVVVRNREELWQRLNSGEGDVVAARLIQSAVEAKDVAFTAPLCSTAPMLIQREGKLDPKEYSRAAQPVVQPQQVSVSAKSIASPARNLSLAPPPAQIPRSRSG